MVGTSDRGGQSLAEIAEYHNDTVDALTFFLQALWEQGASRFHGYSPTGFRDLLHDRIEETELRPPLQPWPPWKQHSVMIVSSAPHTG